MSLLPSCSKRAQSGFSLIEMVIYVALFSMMSVIVMNSLFESIKAFNDLRVSRDVNDSSVQIVERMTRDIKSATAVDLANSTFNISPGQLTLFTVSASGTPMTVEYYATSTMIGVKENGVDKGSLMSAKTKLDALVFHYITTTNTVAVKIELHLSSTRNGINDAEHFYDTVILRGSY